MAAVPRQWNFHLSRLILGSVFLVAACRPIGVHATWSADSASLPINSLLLNQNSASKLCRPSGPGLVGDLLEEAGCRLDVNSTAHHSALLNDTLESIRDMSLRVLKSARRVNSAPTMARSADSKESECGPGCQKTPPCCEVDIKLTFPLYGHSLSSNSVVEIVQGLGDIRQPIIYHECRSTESNLVRGRCVQTSLPRLMYVRSTDGRGARRGYNYHQDLVLVPSSCDCIVSLQTASAKSPLDDTDSNGVPLFVDLPFVTASATSAATAATSAPLPPALSTSATAATTSNDVPNATEDTDSSSSNTTVIQVQQAEAATSSTKLKTPIFIVRPNIVNRNDANTAKHEINQKATKKPSATKETTGTTAAAKREVIFKGLDIFG